jgi:hypothetical protein
MNAKKKGSTNHTAEYDSTKSSWKDRLAILGTSLFLSSSICIFNPFEILTSNRAEFEITFGDVLPIFFGLCIGFAAILTVLVLLIPKRFRYRATVLLLTVGMLLWIQANFLRWEYGEFNGTAINWQAFPWQGWIDIVIWLSVLVLAGRLSRRLSKHALFIAAAFILVQSTVMVTRTLNSRDSQDTPSLRINAGTVTNAIPQEIFRLSSSQNVFHIIMDGYQTDIFMELIEEENLAEKLDGFVVYRDNISTGRRTVMSIPSIFSTEIYDGTVTEAEYFKKAMDRSFHHALLKNNYVVNLIPYITMKKTAYTNYYQSPSTYNTSRRNRLLRASAYLIDVGMFRQFPHFIKRVIYNEQNWRLSSLIGEPPNQLSFHQKAFFRDYIDMIEAAYPEPAYNFLHLMPPHGPFVTLADGSYAGKALPHTRNNYKNEALYILRLFMDFIEKLKRLGLYDSSIILLHGDHGLGIEPIIDGEIMTKWMGWVSAMMLLKPAGAHGPLQSSPAQTSLADIPATLLDLLAITHTYQGESVVKLNPSLNRNRQIVFVEDRSSKEPAVNGWVINGTVYDSTSWHGMTPQKVVQQVHPYDWGTLIKFGISGNGEAYLSSGWTKTSPVVNWNDGHSAELIFGIKEPPRDVIMKITLVPYIVPGKLDQQRINISVNGQLAHNLLCNNPNVNQFTLVVSREMLQSDRMVLSFEFPDAKSPLEIGESHDARILCMGLYRFEAALVSSDYPPAN